MKKLALILVLCMKTSISIIPIHAATQLQKGRNKGAYLKTLGGLALTVAAAGCLISGPLITVAGPVVALSSSNRSAFLGILIGPPITVLAFPLGEAGIKLLKNGIMGLWKKEEMIQT
jgi:hypothetical protein